MATTFPEYLKQAQTISAPCARPEYDYETAAHLWTQARERRDLARHAHEQATAELSEAENAETGAWTQLAEFARGPINSTPPTTPAVRR